MSEEYCVCGQSRSTHDDGEHDAAMHRPRLHPHTLRSVISYAPRRWEPPKSKSLWQRVKELIHV